MLSYVGPIATILIKKAIAKSTTVSDLIEHLIHNLPSNHKAKFRSKANALLKNTNDDTEPGTRSQSTNMQISTLSPESQHSSPSTSGITQINQTFLSKCEIELANFIGPMAKLIVQNANRKLSPQDFIESIAQRIPSPTHANQFRQRMLAEID